MSPLKRPAISICLISLLTFSCVVIAQGPETELSQQNPSENAMEASSSAAMQAGGYLYIGRIVGDDVNIRSGPGEIWYPVGQFDKDQQVIVVEEKFGWCKIEPTRQCFSYINRDFVKLDGQAPLPVSETALAASSEQAKYESVNVNFSKAIPAEVTGNRIRIRAGSLKVEPAKASEVQTKLDQGARIEVLGQQDEFYKIVPPKGCYFWVSKQFVRRSGPGDAETQQTLRSQAGQDIIAGANSSQAAAISDGQETVQDPASVGGQRGELIAIGKLFDAELDKPIAERDFTAIREKLTALLNSTEPSSLKVTTERLNQQVMRAQMAVETWKQSKFQDKQLRLTLAQIEEKVQQLVATESPEGKTQEDIVVKGRLANSAVFSKNLSNRRFLVLDEQNQIIYYAVSDDSGLDLSQWLEKNVSLVGWAEYDTFSRIRVLHVKKLVEIPAQKAVQ